MINIVSKKVKNTEKNLLAFVSIGYSCLIIWPFISLTSDSSILLKPTYQEKSHKLVDIFS